MVEVSIVIVNYNTKDLTLDCVASITESKLQVSYEIIVVDNASSDGSVEALSKKNILLIQNDVNYGFAHANNQGIKKAQGKYVLLLNSDTKVKHHAIDRLIEFAKTTPDAGAVGSKLLNLDGTVQESAFKFPTLSRVIEQYWFGKKRLLDKYAPGGSDPVEVEVLVMAAFLITPLALKKAGLLNEKYFMYFEDFDYCRRLRGVGLKVYYLPDSEVIHYHGASGKQITASDNQWRRLTPSSKIYHGVFSHYLIYFVMWSSEKRNRGFFGGLGLTLVLGIVIFGLIPNLFSLTNLLLLFGCGLVVGVVVKLFSKLKT